MWPLVLKGRAMRRYVKGLAAAFMMAVIGAIPAAAAETKSKTKAETLVACEGPKQLACGDSRDFCQKKVGSCDNYNHEGVCTRPPENCTPKDEPVCGCDGVNYANECEASSEGMNIFFFGECEDA
jgi:hypothetical protein